MLENVSKTRFRGHQIRSTEDIKYGEITGMSRNRKINKYLCTEDNKIIKLLDVKNMSFTEVDDLISAGLYSCEHKKTRPEFCNRSRDWGNCFMYNNIEDVCPYLKECFKYRGEK